MEPISENLLAFYRVVFFLTQNHRLTWRSTGSSAVEAQITNEFKVEFKYFPNSPGAAVADFVCIYAYTDDLHQAHTKKLSGLFRENRHGLFHMLSCKQLFEMALHQSKPEAKTDKPMDSYGLLMEFSLILILRSSESINKNTPFDSILLEKLLYAAMKEK